MNILRNDKLLQQNYFACALCIFTTIAGLHVAAVRGHTLFSRWTKKEPQISAKGSTALSQVALRSPRVSLTEEVSSPSRRAGCRLHVVSHSTGTALNNNYSALKFSLLGSATLILNFTEQFPCLQLLCSCYSGRLKGSLHAWCKPHGAGARAACTGACGAARRGVGRMCCGERRRALRCARAAPSPGRAPRGNTALRLHGV